MSEPPPGEFSVWCFLEDDWHFPIARFVDVATAMEMARRAHLVPGPATRIIVTDGGDDTVFEWVRGKGITFPPQETA